MFAVDHAATALLIKRRYPAVPLAAALLSVQAMEIGWVVFNYLGIERTTVDATVKSVADIHLSYMPFSHSIASGLTLGLAAWWIVAKRFHRATLGLAVSLGIVSHLVLDLLTHARDIALAPGSALMFGTGLYERAPMAAFVIEMAFGLLCWWVYVRGRFSTTSWRGLLAFVVLGNALNLPFLSTAIDGPEVLLGGRPALVVSVILLQIVITLAVVHALARRNEVRETC